MTALIPTPETAVFFFLVLARVLALVASLPFLAFPSIPTTIKGGFAFFVALVVFLALPGPKAAPLTLGGVALASAGEITIGLLMGFVVRAALEAVEIAGELAGFQMGFTVANVVDPFTGGQVSLIGNFQTMVATLIFVVSGLYLVFIGGLVDSFRIIAPGQAVLQGGGLDLLTDIGGRIFVNAVRIGGPLIITMLLANLGLGLMARAFPQMNVFMVGFPITIGLGFLIIAAGMPFFFTAAKSLFTGAQGDMITAIRLLAP
ncbi:flagellar biosynthetic protein FliR [bacterium]|nr:flagellar biosynthetic protein FliR [bacterium]